MTTSLSSIPRPQAVEAALPILLRQLRLGRIRSHWQSIASQAEGEGWSPSQFLYALCEQEVEQRQQARLAAPLVEKADVRQREPQHQARHQHAARAVANVQLPNPDDRRNGNAELGQRVTAQDRCQGWIEFLEMGQIRCASRVPRLDVSRTSARQ